MFLIFCSDVQKSVRKPTKLHSKCVKHGDALIISYCFHFLFVSLAESSPSQKLRIRSFYSCGGRFGIWILVFEPLICCYKVDSNIIYVICGSTFAYFFFIDVCRYVRNCVFFLSYLWPVDVSLHDKKSAISKSFLVSCPMPYHFCI